MPFFISFNFVVMPYSCPICAEDPTSHSLHKLLETDDHVYFYTCPGKATKYADRNGILAHYDGVLREKGDKPWTWIFDCEGFEMKHALEVSLAIDMARLISDSHGNSLAKICVINPTWHVHITVNVIWPFLSRHIRSIIVFDSSNQFALTG